MCLGTAPFTEDVMYLGCVLAAAVILGFGTGLARVDCAVVWIRALGVLQASSRLGKEGERGQ